MDIETATDDSSMQDIAARVEQELYGSNEPEANEGEVVVEDEETLPEANDTDSDDDEGLKEELEDTTEEEELTLADYLGVDDEKLIQNEDGSWAFNAIIDGEEKQVSLKDLTKSYQIQGHVNNKSIALENERKEFQEQQNQVAAGLKERVEGMDSMMKFMEQEIVSEFNGIDWDQLKAQDPGQWAALRQEYSEKAQRLQEAKNLSGQEAQRLNQEAGNAQQAAWQSHLSSEREKMLVENPAWVDNEVLVKDMGVLKEFAKTTYGFEDQDASFVTDHRLIGLIQDARRYREGTAKAESKKDKVVPKFQKSKATQAKSNQLAKARGIKAKKAAVKKSGGSVESVANMLIDRM